LLLLELLRLMWELELLLRVVMVLRLLMIVMPQRQCILHRLPFVPPEVLDKFQQFL
jgi:hypothetical protein